MNAYYVSRRDNQSFSELELRGIPEPPEFAKELVFRNIYQLRAFETYLKEINPNFNDDYFFSGSNSYV